MDNFRLGILGGGQLGRMLLYAAYPLGLECRVLDPDPVATCRFCCPDFVQGDFSDYEAVVEFGRACDAVTVEIENVNVDALRKLESDGVFIFPKPDMLALIQDKGLQKQFFLDHGFPTAPFILLDSPQIGSDDVFFPSVAKLRRASYDGRGVWMVHSCEDLSGIGAPIVLEARADIFCELSVVVCRGLDGSVSVFPPTRLVVDPVSKMLDHLVTPAGLDQFQLEEIESMAKRLALELDLIGVLAIELFLTNDGTLWINELSPRPHNTGHHTIEGNVTSQYAQHLLAGIGWPLGEAYSLWPSVGMLNLVGPMVPPDDYWNLVMKVMDLPGVKVHHYGKQGVRPGRKLGHITVLGQSVEDVETTIKLIKQRISI